MSQRHRDALGAIRREHDDVVVALKKTRSGKKRGAPGVPAFDPSRLTSAIVTAGDAYALLLIATAEGALREYLDAMGVPCGNDPKLSMLIDRAFKVLNASPAGRQLLEERRREMQALRVSRNQYAHGRGRAVFPSVAKVEGVLSRFLQPFPD